jgi:hypothetical protein
MFLDSLEPDDMIEFEIDHPGGNSYHLPHRLTGDRASFPSRLPGDQDNKNSSNTGVKAEGSISWP